MHTKIPTNDDPAKIRSKLERCAQLIDRLDRYARQVVRADIGVEYDNGRADSCDLVAKWLYEIIFGADHGSCSVCGCLECLDESGICYSCQRKQEASE